MTRIAHLTDLHLVEPASSRGTVRTRGQRFRLSLLTLVRPVDAAVHRRRFVDALARARAARADHVVITGDLTEDGTVAQFEVLAEVLAESGWSADHVTLVPGNHDGYDTADAWPRALDGPMRAFRRTSASGAVTELPDATIVAISTAMDQSILRACGRVGAEQLAVLRDTIERSGRRGQAVLAAMHHPPVDVLIGLKWLDGLLDQAAVRSLLEQQHHAHVLSGHLHRNRDFRIGRDTEPRVHTAKAVVACAGLRLYETTGGGLRSVEPDVLDSAVA